MFIGNQEAFNDAVKAAGQNGIRSLADFDGPIPKELWMAAIQFHQRGKVDQSLLLHKNLRPLISPAERKEVKKGRFYDDMAIVSLLDSTIDTAYTQRQFHTDWENMKARYPSSLLSLAEDVNKTGTINPKKITGDIFSADIGMPAISGEKLNKIRYESHLLDHNTDEHYGALLDRLEIARLHLRLEKERKRFFKLLGDAENALESREYEQKAWQDTLEEYARKQMIAAAQIGARIEIIARDVFIESPKAEENKALLGKGINAAIALAVTANAFKPDASPLPNNPVEISASQSYDLSQLPPPEQCSAERPLFFDGKIYNYIISDPNLCRELLQLVPKVGETVQLNEAVSLRGNADGTYNFRISTHRTRAECLDNAPAKLRQRWINTTGVTNLHEACQEVIVKENDITPENFNAIVEASLFSAGEDGKSTIAAYLISKWFLESRHGELMASPLSTARGMNQFIAPTWVEQILKRGNNLKMGHIRQELIDAAARIGISEEKLLSSGNAVKKLSYSKEGRALHLKYTSDPHHSAVLGADFSIQNLIQLRKGFETGKIPHPLGAGHTEVTAEMGYTCQLLGFDGCRKLITAYVKNPDLKVNDVLKGGVYSRNKGLFQLKIYKRDKNGEYVLDRKGNRISEKIVKMTIGEYMDNLRIFGHNDKPLEAITNYDMLNAQSARVSPDIKNTTFLTLDEAKGRETEPDADHKIAVTLPDRANKALRQLVPGSLVPERPQVAQAKPSAAAVLAFVP